MRGEKRFQLAILSSLREEISVIGFPNGEDFLPSQRSFYRQLTHAPLEIEKERGGEEINEEGGRPSARETGPDAKPGIK